MSSPSRYTLRRLKSGDFCDYEALMTMFGEAFDDVETYTGERPDEHYVASLLGDDRFIALVACDGDTVVGGLVAYELRKFERARSELYIYDLAVRQPHRRRGIATLLIDEVSMLADECKAWVVFVQADHGDDPAIALYSSLGEREDVMHFDIAPRPRRADR